MKNRLISCEKFIEGVCLVTGRTAQEKLDTQEPVLGSR